MGGINKKGFKQKKKHRISAKQDAGFADFFGYRP